MRVRLLTAIGVLATLSVISVPAQHAGPVAGAQTTPPEVLTGLRPTALRTTQGRALSSRTLDPGSYIVELPGNDRKVVAASPLVHGDVGSAVVREPMPARSIRVDHRRRPCRSGCRHIGRRGRQSPFRGY